MILHNFANRAVTVQLNQCYQAGEYPIDLFGENRYRSVSLEEPLELGPYGYRWLRISDSPWHH